MKNKIEGYKKNLIGVVNDKAFPKILEKALELINSKIEKA